SRSSNSRIGLTRNRRFSASTDRSSTDGLWPSARHERARIAVQAGRGRAASAGRAPAGSAPPRPGGGGFGGPPSAPGAPAPPRSRNFGPDAKPQRGPNAKAKKKESERPRGLIPMKVTGRSFTLDDVDQTDDDLPDMDNFAASKPHTEEDEDKE